MSSDLNIKVDHLIRQDLQDRSTDPYYEDIRCKAINLHLKKMSYDQIVHELHRNQGISIIAVSRAINEIKEKRKTLKEALKNVTKRFGS